MSATAAATAPDAAGQIAGLVIAVLTLDPGFAVVEANPAAEDLFGTGASRLRGADLFDLFRLDDPAVAASLRAAQGAFIARGVRARAGQRDTVVDMTAAPLAGHPGWHVLTLLPVGEREEPADRAGGEVGAPAILAHEIKNPLAAIRGAAQLLARRAPPQDRPLAELIEGEVDRIARLIDRMQQLGRQSAEPLGPVNLHQVIRNAMATVRAGRPDGPPLVEAFDPSLPLVHAAEDALGQVMVNLLANACDAVADRPDGLVTVRTRFAGGVIVRAFGRARARHLPIEVAIIDNGAGVPEALREHIFRPFVTSKHHGQGLGLALVRKLVADMGGRIAHDRAAGAGLTHFRLQLGMAEGMEADRL